MDRIADFLTRIRNANAKSKDRIDVPLTNMKLGIAKILKDEGFIANYKTLTGEKTKPTLRVFLKYSPAKEKVIRGLKKVSRLGLRVYRSYRDIPWARGAGFPVTIMSTSKGLLTGTQAKEQKVGGEVVCQVW